MTFNVIDYLHTLAACDAELARLGHVEQDRTLRKQDGALGRVKRMQAAVAQRRAQLVQQGITD